MIGRIIKITALLSCLATASAAAGIMDYKNIGPRETIRDAVRNLASDDVEAKRAATDDLQELRGRQTQLLGVDPSAEKALALLGDGLIELLWLGKATSRIRSERILEETVEVLAPAMKSSDQAKAAAAKRILEHYASNLARNPSNSSSEKATAQIRAAFAAAGQTLEVKPATTVASFLEDEKPSAQPAGGVQANAAPAEPASPPAPAQTPGQQGEKASPPPPASPEPEKEAKDRSLAAAAPGISPQTAIVVKRSSGPEDPAVKVTTIRAPGAGEEGVEPKRQEEAQVPEASSSVLNLLLIQLEAKSDSGLESALKLTAKVADVVVASSRVKSDQRPQTIAARVRGLINHTGRDVSLNAMRASVSLKDRMAAPVLVEALASGDGEKAAAARTALISITGRDFGPESAKWKEWLNGDAK